MAYVPNMKGIINGQKTEMSEDCDYSSMKLDVIPNNLYRKCFWFDFAVPAKLEDHRVKIEENEKRNRYQDLARELKKSMEGDGDTNCNCCT